MIKRKLLKELQAHLSKKEITMITGPRQAGKTTLMLRLADELVKNGERTLYLNTDFEEEKQYFSSHLKLLSKIELEIGKEAGYVFIDEVQRIENAGLFLKGLYDRNLPYKLIISGSGSIELKEKIHESLAGRKQIFELGTVSFEEFVDYKTDYRYEGDLGRFLELESEKAAILLENYLSFGGYPRVVLEDEVIEKRKVIDEIYQSYINRDIAALLRVLKLDSYSQLIRVLSAQAGNIVNHNELSKTLGVSLPTISNYLWYTEKTYILRKLTPYFSNKRKEIVKSPIYYFVDSGFRNYAAGMFGQLNLLTDYGFLFESLVLNIINEQIRFTGATVHFWRSKDGAEVNFVIDYKRKLLPIEAKYRKMKKPEYSRSLLSFIKSYSPQEAVVVNLTLDGVSQVGNTRVRFIPFFRLSELLWKLS